jgi:sortase A
MLHPAKPSGSPWMRRLGNLLIAAGLLLMVGVGAFLGIQTYTNSQTTEKINSETTGLFAPPAASTPGQSSSSSSGGLVANNNAIIVSDAPLANLNASPTINNFAGILGTSKPPTKIQIPSVGINTGIVPVGWEMLPGKDGQKSSQWKVAEFAAGHHQGTANPGQVGNVVISGHVDWKGEVFRDLHNVQRGAEIHLYTDEREFLYIVQDVVLVLEDGATEVQKLQNARYMDPTPDQRLTLITCYPYGIDDHRLIVIAKPYDSGLPARPDLIVR